MSGLSKAYQPTEVEEKWFQKWIDGKCFAGDADSEKSPFSIVIPPPNVTGVLTLGHVLNNTIQDILARRARMQGKEVMWLPGTDHAGIATQKKVVDQLQEEGTTRRELGREKFLERAWEWKEKHGGIIIKQLKKLGCSCDWERERFTMDEDYSRRVQECFVHFFESGHIYRGKRMVNWCPVHLTALSDEEVIMKPRRSKLYYMRYRIAGTEDDYLEIATTRPETLMGDTAVAVNPKDPRYAELVGKNAIRPFPEAEIPIIADEHIDIEFGTGVLKVTPAHDKADFEIGVRNNLEIIDVLNPDGTLNALAGEEFEGLDRFVARKKAAAKLDEMGLLIKVEEYENNVGFSERADVPIEPRLSMQWFLRYPQVEKSTEAVAKREIIFRPDRWAKTYAHWMENIQDWCISRQLWWGHRIPVWYQKDRAEELQNAESLDKETAGDAIHVGFDPPADPENWIQDEDVLDTWFSSWLWPFGTMDDATRAKFYPTSDLVTGPDIIFFWVARMIMAGYEFTDQRPFANVFFTSLIRDKEGRKMSKSLGNSPDPLDLIAKYGADALRFSIMRIAPSGSDVRFIANVVKNKETGEEETDCPQVEEGRNFANKLWNAARYRQMQEGEVAPAAENLESLSIYAIDILAKLDRLAVNLARSYDEYRFNDVAQQLYEYFWSNYCDLYLEAIKRDFGPDANADAKARTLGVIDAVLARYLVHLHPYMPHITEDLWETMGQEGFLMQAELPKEPILAAMDDERVTEACTRAAAVYDTCGRARNLKAEYNLGANKNVKFMVKASPDWFAKELDTFALLSGAGEVIVDPDFAPKGGTPVAVTDLGEFYMPLEGLVDVEAERGRLGKEIAKRRGDLEKAAAKLNNPKFVDNAKPEIVEEHRQRRDDLVKRLEQLEELLANLD